MNHKNIGLILLLIILIIYIIYYFLPCKKIQYWENIKYTFDLDNIKKKYGDIMVELGNFTDNGKPNLYPIETIDIRFSEWFDNNSKIIGMGNKQTRIFFYRDTTNPLTQYILEWLNNMKPVLPSEIVDILDSNISLKFSLRISRGRWEYPSHFDAINTYMLILSGNRRAILNYDHMYNLKPHDILYFAAGVEHHFWCESFNDLNIVLCISYYDKNKDDDIKSEFVRIYPKQVKKLNNLDDFIDYYSYKNIL
jgi:hypothetical protein